MAFGISRQHPGLAVAGRTTLKNAATLATVLVAAVACSGSANPGPASQERRGTQATSASDEASLALRALREPAPRSSQVVQALRDRGPTGLAALLAAAGPAPDSAARQVIAVVAGQLDADVSGLYWHTDFERALTQAQAEGKPILSLRLLGRLDDELSCANSRLFRTTLYPDAQVSKLLRERFVLHWASERKVPRVTIDYGDGRRLERTITGNSIHYVMDNKGRVVDALPGLYGAAAFARALGELHPVATQASDLDGAQWSDAVRAHHRRALTETRAALMANLRAAKLDAGQFVLAAPGRRGKAPTAKQAVPIAITKAAIEAPVVQRTVPTFGELERRIDRDAVWQRLALLERSVVRLDDASRKVVARKRPVTWSEADGRVRPATGKELQRMLSVLQNHIAQDTLKNELMLRRRIHEWLSEAPLSYVALNKRVYADLFLTPASDPWLGLLPRDVFSGLPQDGVQDLR